MQYSIALVAALLGSASAAPALQARGGRHSYSKSCNWLGGKSQTFTCDDSHWWAEHNCCKTEKKCYQQNWGNSFECCTADQWDWIHNCPISYYNSGDYVKYQQIITYYGGYTQECQNNYKFDCDNGRQDNYRSGQWKSYSSFCSSNPSYSNPTYYPHNFPNGHGGSYPHGNPSHGNGNGNNHGGDGNNHGGDGNNHGGNGNNHGGNGQHHP